MCDFSLKAVKSRPAVVADKLVTHNFGYGTSGFRDSESEIGKNATAVCVLPGTEIGFEKEIELRGTSGFLGGYQPKKLDSKVAIFRQINKDQECAHHDALELPNGEVILLTGLEEGQMATVLQVPVDAEKRMTIKELEPATETELV